MMKLILDGWREGLEKISLTKLQMEKLGLSLKESKSNVDALLNDEIVTLEIKDTNVANEFMENAEKVGANCRLVKY